jgi:hypothetical protein
VITHTNQKAWDLMYQGVVKLEPGEILGPSPDLMKRLGLYTHSERMFQNILIELRAPWSINATVGTWPLGCHMCQQWFRVTLPNIIHQNPKP